MPPENIPNLQPATKSTDPVIARFEGWVAGFRSSPKGYTQMIIAVDTENKYHAMRATDFPGLVRFELRQPKPEDVLEGLDDDLLAALEKALEEKGD